MHLRNRRPVESKQLMKQDGSMNQHKALEHKERVCVTRSELAVPYTRADEPMARVSKMALGKISLARSIQAPGFLSFTRPSSLYCEEYVHTHTHPHPHPPTHTPTHTHTHTHIYIYDCVDIVYE